MTISSQDFLDRVLNRIEEEARQAAYDVYSAWRGPYVTVRGADGMLCEVSPAFSETEKKMISESFVEEANKRFANALVNLARKQS